MSTPPTARITIIGAGLVGSLLATLLAQRGFDVEVFERRPDPRRHGFLGGRSINLSLVERGLRPLRMAGLADAVLERTVTMTGRMVHATDGTTTLQRYGIDDSEVDHSVGRGDLNTLLLDAAEAAGARVRFGAALAGADLANGTIALADPDGAKRTHEAGLLLGCDGAGSALRAAMAKVTDLGERIEPLGHGYKELEIPALESSRGLRGEVPECSAFSSPRLRGEVPEAPSAATSQERPPPQPSPASGGGGRKLASGEGGGTPATGGAGQNLARGRAGQDLASGGSNYLRFALEPHALHIWPRGNYMCIALPNTARNFTVTLFLPEAGAHPSFATLPDLGAARAFFGEQFPDALALMPAFDADWSDHPVGQLSTLYLGRWHLDGTAVVLGDAAHAIVPFHGQGMNAGFEDAAELATLMADTPRDPGSVFAEFAARRKPDADAIAAMSLANYIEMRDQVADPRYLLKRELAAVLTARAPAHFMSRYRMVSFTSLPYADCLERDRVQRDLMENLLNGHDRLQDVDLDAAVRQIKSTLVPLPQGT